MSNIEKIINWLPALGNASLITLGLTAASVSAGLVLSVFLALGKIQRVEARKGPLLPHMCKLILSCGFRWFCSGYVFFFRGTPLLLQLYFIYYGLPKIDLALAIPSFTAAWVAFTLNIAAYLAEIIRAAIQSIPKGQMEASRALGLTFWQAMRLVVLPQAYRRMVPPVCNEFVMVLKDTSLVAIIGLMDLSARTQKIVSADASALVFIPALIIYLVMTAFFTVFFNRVEKKLATRE